MEVLISLKDVTETTLMETYASELERTKDKGLTLTSGTNETKAYIYSRGRTAAPFGMITADEDIGGHKYAPGSNAGVSRVIG